MQVIYLNGHKENNGRYFVGRPKFIIKKNFIIQGSNFILLRK